MPTPASRHRGFFSHRRTLQLMHALLLTALAVSAGSALAQPTPEPEYNYNWMQEHVRQRLQIKELSSASASAGPLERGDVQRAIQPKIVGGTGAQANDNPFQVGLLNRNTANNMAAQFCGGTLLRANVIVTAAHCSDFVVANQVQVLTGARRLDGTGVRRDVTRITLHPNWNPRTFDHDVAVWELASSATGEPVATLATEDGPVGDNLLATGWGALTEGGASPIDLRRVLLPMVDRANCNDANSYNGQITNNMLCAGLDGGGRDTCQGDSGGPLTRGPGNSVLTGITSWGTGCARPNLFGIYARVSQPAIRDFIVTAAGLGGAAPSPVSCRVFNDGYTRITAPSDATYFAANSAACRPDGTARGTCRKWFGRCTTTGANPQAVNFRVFNDGDTQQTATSDAIYNRAPNVSCIPDGTASGNCRRWFGLGQAADGRRVQCRLFNDGYRNMVGPTHAIYYRRAGQVCMPDGTASGTCRKWFGRCEAR